MDLGSLPRVPCATHQIRGADQRQLELQGHADDAGVQRALRGLDGLRGRFGRSRLSDYRCGIDAGEGAPGGRSQRRGERAIGPGSVQTCLTCSSGDVGSWASEAADAPT